jgi:hypothetical protein
MAINRPNLISDWQIAPIIRDIHQNLALFPNWEASKVQRQPNLQAHLIAK